jgi:uncharacterized protein (TIGR02680 family)
MTALAELTALPGPGRRRWQPLRVGLVELYHYDCEEFWFHDGHLLLRGNNGTGKSKVLSLTLPFLLDGYLTPTRVEPDGDRGKRMEWNLLMGRYERRTGYAWIEFGRRDEAGEPHYLTLGCGMSAVAGRARIDHWHFITEQRIGQELWLLTPERTVLGRERLAERLGDRGQLFDTVTEYRRALDERLYRLGEARYRALMDTLIQLRQPQLSRQPDEQKLSDALTEALAPLPEAALADVAEAMTQLDESRGELEEIEALRAAIAQFERRYRTYARVLARRQARELRQAQTEFDNASRALNEARRELDGAAAALQDCEARRDECARQLLRDRAALDELRRDPVMRDAQRLQDAERLARQSAGDAERARRRAADAGQARRQEHERAEQRRSDARQAQQVLAQARTDAQAAAAHIGVAAEHERACASPQAMEAACREIVKARREHVAQVRQRLAAVDQAAAARDRAADNRNRCAGADEQAAQRAAQADEALARAGATLAQAWRVFADSLRQLALADADAALESLAGWIETLAGDNPAQAALMQAQQAAIARLAEEEAQLKQRRAALREEAEQLTAERARLLEGQDPVPPAPYTRAPAGRAGRPGAPLWQLVDFASQVDQAHRAGLEAALEGAGLLDAWVTPEGVLLDADTADVLLIPRAACAASLCDWLVPAQQPAVERERIARLLASVACAEDDPLEVEAWVSPHGRFRLGPKRGAWRKVAAQYIGSAAREQARRRRICEIETRLRELAGEAAEVGQLLDAAAQRRGEVNAECARAPSDSALRDAHAAAAAAHAQRRDTAEQLRQAEAAWQAAEERWRQAHDALLRDAADLRLPADAQALAGFEARLVEYRDAAARLLHATRDEARAARELAEQQQRASAAAAAADDHGAESARLRLAAEEAAARYALLKETIGAAVETLQARLRASEVAVTQGSHALDKLDAGLRAAVERRARCEQKSADAETTLAERHSRRQTAVERFQGFARTGLLDAAAAELALPDLEPAWTVDPALQLARRVEQALANVTADDAERDRLQSEVQRDFNQLLQAMTAHNQQAYAEPSDFGFVVQIVYRNRRERPDALAAHLADEIAQRREILTAREREVIENHLQAEVAAELQRLLREADERLQRINDELGRRATSTGVKFKLEWQPLPEGEDGAPAGLAAVRARLLNRAPEAWSAEDRRAVGDFLHNRIRQERSREEGGTLLEHLARALDYRRWHRFRVKRFQDGAWRPLSGPASSGERALGLTVPLFAAASSHYASAASPLAPRLVLLDEAFAGIDVEARAHCMALIREFDLDFMMTSESEWGCYAELPALAICNLVRLEGVDAVYVSRWRWDGASRREVADPTRRFPEALSLSA